MSETIGRTTHVALETTYTAADGSTAHNKMANSQRLYLGDIAYLSGSATGVLTMAYAALTIALGAAGDWALTIAASTVAGAEGGDIDFTAGKGFTTGTGGDITFTAGAGGTTSGAGGDVTVNAGAGGDTSGAGGAWYANAGAGTAGNANGGAMRLRAGAKHGIGTDGTMAIGDANTSAIQIGATGITTTFPGAVTVTQALTGNLTGNASGSSGSCTGNSATATTAGTVTGYTDGIPFNFGTSNDVTLTYDGTDNVLDEQLTSAGHCVNISNTASATCTEGSVISVTGSTAADATVDEKTGIGICRVGGAGAATITVAVSGIVPATTDGILGINRPLKSCTGGRVGEMIDSVNASAVIKTVAAGAAFTNQPTNDSITFVSASAADTQNLVMYGTTNGTDTVVVETKALNGVGAVASTKVNWGEMLGFELSAPATGTITITETSGGLGITTIAPLASSVGVESVTVGAGQRAFNGIPTIVSDAATTKQVGVVGTGVDYATLFNNSKNLNGTTKVPLATAMSDVQKVLVGDLEAARSVTVQVRATEDDAEMKIARSLQTASAKDQTKRVLIEKGI